jgi:hypothetical protein
MVTLNIKNEDVVRLVKELAEREGKSMTAMVRELAEERLERDRQPRVNEERMQYWLDRGKEIRTHLMRTNPEWLEHDPTDDLYDEETGLPK